MSHVESFYQEIIEKGGEGIILRDPLAPYQHGRSSSFLKHKVGQYPSIFEQISPSPNTQKFRDAEARVLRSVGPHQWECELYVSTLVSPVVIKHSIGRAG